MNAFYTTYASMVGILILSIVWDFIPVTLLLVFHYRNFKERDDLKSNILEHSYNMTHTSSNKASGSFEEVVAGAVTNS